MDQSFVSLHWLNGKPVGAEHKIMDRDQEVSVFQGNEMMARMALLRLDSHGIPAELIGFSLGGPAAIYGGGGTGVFNVVVLKKDVERAVTALNEEVED